MPLPFRRHLEHAQALGFDCASFALVNLLQARHPLPVDFRAQWEGFTQEWQERPVADFYALPPEFELPALPQAGRFHFPTPHPGAHEANNRAAFDFFPSAAGWSAPTMLLAHGLMSVSDRGYRLWARRLNARGWNAIFIHLPYHYSRRVRGQFHGEMAVGGELIRSAQGIRQAVVECRLILRALQRAGGSLFGGWGTSYGGWIMALLGSFEPLVQRLILVEPILNLHHAIWQAPSSFTVRRALRRAGINKELTAWSMRLACPAFQQPQLPGANILLLAGEYDRIAPPAEIEALHRAWGTHYACFPQGHVGYTLMPESFRLAQEIWAADFTAETGSAPVAEILASQPKAEACGLAELGS